MTEKALAKNNKTNFLTNLSVGYNLTRNAYEFWRERQERIREAKAFYVIVEDEDNAYYPLHDWLMSNSEMDSRSIKVKSRWVDSRLEARLYVDDKSPKDVYVGGHKIRVYLAKQQKGTTDTDGYMFKQPDRLTFEATSEAGQKAVLEFIEDICRKESREGGRLFTMSSWGDWAGGGEHVRRPIESVFLGGNQKQEMIDDLEHFLSSEDRYNAAGIPWHRGYLFHGPAGTGKTSLAKALASHFKIDLYYVSLGDLQKDAKLLTIMRNISPKSILLLEDIDVFSSTHSREASKDEVSLSGLLNALDGVATPHGLITIMTTNHRETLDEAVTRPGRVDKDIEVGYASSKQVADMFRFYYGEELGFTFTVPSTSPAQITEVFKTHMQDVEGARQVLMEIQSQELDKAASV